MNRVIDLDALVPEAVTVKIGGEELQVSPPKTADVLRLAALGQKMQDIDKQTPDQLDELIASLTEQIRKCVPQLADRELTTIQLMKLVEIINQMSVPPDAEELKRRGITPESPKAR